MNWGERRHFLVLGASIWNSLYLGNFLLSESWRGVGVGKGSAHSLLVVAEYWAHDLALVSQTHLSGDNPLAAVGYCDQVIAASSPSSPSPEKPFSLPATTWLRAGSVSGDSSLAQATLLLLLSRFSRVRLCATSQTAAHQAPPSLGFTRQEHWSGLPFPFPMHESEKWKWSHSVVSDSSWPYGLHPTRLLCPWGFPDKSAGVGCHCLLLHRP